MRFKVVVLSFGLKPLKGFLWFSREVDGLSPLPS